LAREVVAQPRQHADLGIGVSTAFAQVQAEQAAMGQQALRRRFQATSARRRGAAIDGIV